MTSLIVGHTWKRHNQLPAISDETYCKANWTITIFVSIVDYHNPSQTNGGKREECEVADPKTWNVSRRYLGRGGGQITQGDPKSPPMTLLELSSRKKEEVVFLFTWFARKLVFDK